MDVSDRLSSEYKNGVDEFLQFSLDHATNLNAILCPCLHCENLHKLSITKIKSIYSLMRLIEVIQYDIDMVKKF